MIRAHPKYIIIGFILACSPITVFAESEWRNGTSLVGKLKYAKDFKRFDYVNPQAPKGGILRLSTLGTFSNLNNVPDKPGLVDRLGLIYDSLMVSSDDEIASEYGLIAEAVKYPDDFSKVTFRLNPKARWHDGKPVTPDDVIFSFQSLKKHNSLFRFYYAHVEKAFENAPGEVTFSFSQTGNRELPHIVGQLPILPKHWWQGTDASGKPRDISKTTLEPPLGSGPYRIKQVVPDKTVVYERVADYWGRDLPVNIGKNNFNEIHVDYFKNAEAEFQAFLAGDVDFRAENRAKNWAIGYDVPAVKNGDILRKKIPTQDRGVMQGFIFNTRRAPLDNILLREALNYAFNFEELNRAVFYNQYQRPNSYFSGSELAATGKPDAAEQAIMDEIGLAKDDTARGEMVINPVAGNRKAFRNNLRKALGLLKKAGFERQGNQLVNIKTGAPLHLEFLYRASSESTEAIALALQRDFRLLGVELALRAVDDTQYQARVIDYDYDMILTGWAQSLSPGNEQLEYFGSGAAKRKASRNYSGVSDPVVDAIINRLIYATDRQDLEAAIRVYDRILMSRHLLIPGWFLPFNRLAYRKELKHPSPLPKYGLGFPSIWWMAK